MPESASKAVFLSYASQDAEAARRICEALRSGGVEVWFDADGGLEHGDEWDAKIRRQIKECVLFIPVISGNTQAREEGYFRIEWELAAQRALGIASGVPFILPVVIDDTREPDALVPDRFRAVQWTRLRGGEMPAEVRTRLLKLWSHRAGVLKHEEDAGRGLRTPPARKEAEAGFEDPALGKPGAKTYALVGLAVLAIVSVAGWWLLARKNPPAPPPAPLAAVKSAPAVVPLSDARQLIAKTGALMDALDNSRDDFKLADELIAQAKAKDPMDAEVWAAEAQLHERYLIRGWDVSDARRESARAAVQRAIRLDPQSFEARFAQANLLADTGRDATEKERLLAELRRERPTDQRVLRGLAAVVDRLGRMDEAAAIADESAALPGGDPLALYNKSLGFWFVGRTAEAETAIQASLAQQPFTGALLIAAWYRLAVHGDLDGARGFLARVEPGQLGEDRAAFFAYCVEYLGRRPDAAIARLQALPRDWVNDFWHRGPKGELVGDALEMGGRHDAAVLEWNAALKLVEQRLAASPNNTSLIYNRTRLLLSLGRREEAERQFALLLQMRSAVDIGSSDAVARCYAVLGRKAEALQIIATGLKYPSHAVTFPSGRLRIDPAFDSLRGEPEFTKLIAEAEALERATGPAAPKSDLTTTAPAKADEKSIAVLAFADNSPAHDSEYFSDGISEELINALGKVPGLKVPGRTSSFYFKGKNAALPEIADKLGVAYVIEGSVQRAGDKVKIGARLTKAADGFQVWTDSFTRDAKDVFAVEEEIAGLIAKNLSLKLGAAPAAATASVNPQALELYLQATQLMRLRDTIFMNTERVGELLDRALALEPNFTRAQGMLAMVLIGRGGLQTSMINRFGQRHSPEQARIEAKVRQAIALDPTSPDGHLALALGRWIWWDRAGAENELRTVLALNPSDARAHRALGYTAMDDGRMDDAIAEVKLAVQLDPFSQDVIESCARTLHLAGRYTEAIAMYDRALALGDSLVAREHKAYALAQFGQKDAALALARGLPSDGGPFRPLAAAGARAEAEKALPTDEPQNRAYYLLMLGRTAEGLAALEPDEMQSTYVHDVLYEAWFDPVRDEPRFRKILETLGMTEAHARAQAWRKAHPPEKSEAKK